MARTTLRKAPKKIATGKVAAKKAVSLPGSVQVAAKKQAEIIMSGRDEVRKAKKGELPKVTARAFLASL